MNTLCSSQEMQSLLSSGMRWVAIHSATSAFTTNSPGSSVQEIICIQTQLQELVQTRGCHSRPLPMRLSPLRRPPHVSSAWDGTQWVILHTWYGIPSSLFVFFCRPEGYIQRIICCIDFWHKWGCYLRWRSRWDTPVCHLRCRWDTTPLSQVKMRHQQEGISGFFKMRHHRVPSQAQIRSTLQSQRHPMGCLVKTPHLYSHPSQRRLRCIPMSGPEYLSPSYQQMGLLGVLFLQSPFSLLSPLLCYTTWGFLRTRKSPPAGLVITRKFLPLSCSPKLFLVGSFYVNPCPPVSGVTNLRTQSSFWHFVFNFPSIDDTL